jgi:DNA-binding transcriptional ArsR family regulator
LINHEDELARTRMPVDQLSHTFAALADPTRRAILERLADGEATVNELAEPFPLSVQAISKHLKVLEHAGLVTRGRAAQQRPAQLDGRALEGAAEWLARYRRFWEASFDALDEHLRVLTQEARKQQKAASTDPGTDPSTDPAQTNDKEHDDE